MTETPDFPAMRGGPFSSHLRRRMVERILATVGKPDSFDDYRRPKGDRGLFGPDSIAWIVHCDLSSMLIGGISALMLQTLHPLAMAGIADHSNYREEPLDRLQRTARFVAGTTYGPTPLADQLIAVVKAVHLHVTGTADDGRAYRADDPDLLTWVHVTEVSSFLHSYERFGPEKLTDADKDRYLSEVAILALRLGATTVPSSVVEVDQYFAAIRPELQLTPHAQDAVEFLRTPASTQRSQRLAHHLVVAESIALLPDFARQMLELRQLPVIGASGAFVGAKVFSSTIRWAMGPSRIAALAAERVASP